VGCASTPEQREAVIQRPKDVRTLRKTLRRMLEHTCEHFAELSRRPGRPEIWPGCVYTRASARRSISHAPRRHAVDARRHDRGVRID
jgi:hypothetical protein